MRGTLTEKILKKHLVSGELVPGSEIALRMDQTLTQDATGTMAYLEYEAMGTGRVKTELSLMSITIRFSPDLKTPTITATYRAAPQDTGSIIRAPATEYVIRCISSGSAFPAKRLSDRTAIRLQPAV